MKLARSKTMMQRLGTLAGQGLLVLITSASTIAVVFIFYVLARDALAFMKAEVAKRWK